MGNFSNLQSDWLELEKYMKLHSKLRRLHQKHLEYISYYEVTAWNYAELPWHPSTCMPMNLCHDLTT